MSGVVTELSVVVKYFEANSGCLRVTQQGDKMLYGKGGEGEAQSPSVAMMLCRDPHSLVMEGQWLLLSLGALAVQ